MKVLVYGAKGWIGQQFCKLLNEEKKLENPKNFQIALKKFKKSVIKNFKKIKNKIGRAHV